LIVTEREPSGLGSPFWRFSLRFYRQPGVADACIALQEQSGVDVNLLLFLLWHAMHGRRLSAAEIARLEAMIAPWRELTVVPLRDLRRALKSPPALVEAGTAESFRTRIKAVELEAERLQQEAMHSLAAGSMLGETVPSASTAARENLRAYAGLCRAPFAAGAVDTVLSALAAMGDAAA
jgi:uncharacterized protein (TIGR02444 family)